ncbi:MAG: glycosyltransferase [Candidatus Pacebacteria bacterium]|nr:glycosyltransferase [Candidatus Paceibacterota bacterium]
MAEEEKQYKQFASLDPAEKAAKGLHAAIDDILSEEDDIVVLDAALRKKHQARKTAEVAVQEVHEAEASAEVPVDVALTEQPVLHYASGRQRARLLIFTRDTTMIADESASQKRVLELAAMFEEVHVIVLNIDVSRRDERIRVSRNAWVYPTHSNAWWRTPFDAYRVAREQLVFGNGFRADMVIAEDAFECGLVGYRVARKYGRAFQVHVTDDFFDPQFPDMAPHNDLRVWMARFVLARVDCVRTRSEYLTDRIVAKYPDLTSATEMLPMYNNLEAWRSAAPTCDVHDSYPQFKFILLHVSSMLEHSRTDKVILGAARILNQYPTVGLIIVGTGPQRETIEDQIAAYGLTGKVIIDTDIDKLQSYMKTANLLLHFSGEAEGDLVVLRAAAAGLPMVVGESGIADELFVDGESAFICPDDNPVCMGEKINRFLSENQLRARFAMNATNIVFDRVEQRYDMYMRAYRESIERCLIADSYREDQEAAAEE